MSRSRHKVGVGRRPVFRHLIREYFEMLSRRFTLILNLKDGERLGQVKSEEYG